MPMSAKEYREHLHATRQHPNHATVHHLRKREKSLAGVYLSIIPALLVEYFVELKVQSLPSGIVFPAGYFLFWAFYYSYNQPSIVSNGLSRSSSLDLLSVVRELLAITMGLFKNIKLQKRKPVRHVASKGHHQYVPQPPTIPKEIESAMQILGVKGCKEWRQVQKRYRELAKKYHPDLNPELTQQGKRFMIYDAAYRRLAAVKEKYFI